MTTLGVLVGNRGFFPAELCEQGRKTVLAVLKEEGFDAVALSPKDTKYGSVESFADAKKCAELFKANRQKIDGILVTLPNFGDERGIADTIRLAGLDVPVLVHAFPDEPGRMGIAHRRDSFCGKMSACNNLTQYGIRYSLTSQHTMDPEWEEFRADLESFGGVCRVVRAMRKARFAQIGARPAAFVTVRYSEKLLERTRHLRGEHRPVGGLRQGVEPQGQGLRRALQDRRDQGLREDHQDPQGVADAHGEVRRRPGAVRGGEGAGRHGHPVLDFNGRVFRRCALHRHEHDEQRAGRPAPARPTSRAWWGCMR